MDASEEIELRPQAGPQEAFLSCPADIAIYGGAAGGGKTWALLLDPMRGFEDPDFTAVIFRRTSPEITAKGGLWDESHKLYPLIGGEAKESPSLEWNFPSGASLQMRHLQHTKDAQKHKGAQYAFIGFDELTSFEEEQFWYLYTRARSMSSVVPYMRGTTNPDADSWVRELIDWWLDDDGYPIPERSGVLRYFVRVDDAIHWVDEDYRDEDGQPPTSITFIPAKLDDNPALLKVDPSYRSKLRAQDRVTRMQLEGGNWNVSRKDGLFKYHTIDKRGVHIDRVPKGLLWMRYWDLANTEPSPKNPDPDWTAGALCALHRAQDGTETLYIRDMKHVQLSGNRKHDMMKSAAEVDGLATLIGIEEEGGNTGSESATDYKTRILPGYRVITERPTGDKVLRASAWVGLAEEGRVILVSEDGRQPEWANAFIAEINTFPFGKKDQVDAVSGAYRFLKHGPRRRKPRFIR